MKFRKIRIGLLFQSGIAYRLFVTGVQACFFWAITGEPKLAVSISIIWNILNMACYYVYHYFFASMFKLGRE